MVFSLSGESRHAGAAATAGHVIANEVSARHLTTPLCHKLVPSDTFMPSAI